MSGDRHTATSQTEDISTPRSLGGGQGSSADDWRERLHSVPIDLGVQARMYHVSADAVQAMIDYQRDEQEGEASSDVLEGMQAALLHLRAMAFLAALHTDAVT